MNARVGLLAVCAAMAWGLSGCVTPPAGDPTPRPATTLEPAQSSTFPIDTLEERHYQRAQIYARERNWADALLQWELLALLKPDSREYRDAIAETRARIRENADRHARAAEQARRQGNLDQAMLMYLRVLNVDRDNMAAAQALKEIEAERTRRAYLNRPPR